jgi:hypothetical protein
MIYLNESLTLTFSHHETVSQLLFCHPEFISGSHNHLILLDAETILKQVQHRAQHDIFHHFNHYDTVSMGRGSKRRGHDR